MAINLGRLEKRTAGLRAQNSMQLQQSFGRVLQGSGGAIKGRRTRLFSTCMTFWLFLWQTLSPDPTCKTAVLSFLAWLALKRDRVASSNTAAYCKARMRLPMTAIQSAHANLVENLERHESSQTHWHGHRVLVVDGTGISMPDTSQNQEQYPQSKSSKPGCGFPEMKLVALFSLATGALLRHGESSRKHGELTLFRRLWDVLRPGDIVLADRGFCNFADFYRLAQRKVDSVMRLHQRRKTGVTLVKRLGVGDELVQWHKSKPVPKGLTKEQWAAMPDRLTVRHITFNPAIPGFRTKIITIATTLTDHKQYPAAAFAELYRRRWLVELFLRDIKTTMGMDILRCKTPEMIEKELTMHLIAYNLVRLTMLQAARMSKLKIERISFKTTLTALCQWAQTIQAAPKEQRLRLYQKMLQAIARDPLPNRPNRIEPRVRKRRPKNYQLMNKPRHEMQEIQHRNRYKSKTNNA